MAASLARKSRKVPTKIRAVIQADGFTGRQARLEIRPVDCSFKAAGKDHPGLLTCCDIDPDRCTRCELCGQVRPRDALEMVPTPVVERHVTSKGFSPRYVDESWVAQLDQARRDAAG